MLNGRTVLKFAVLATLSTALGVGLAYAQSPLGIGSAEPGFRVGGPLGGIFAWVNAEQQAFYRALTGALKGMRENPWQLTSLIGLSFAYGVFHAAGPGHGKAVISSYMIANETELKRGILISFISAFMQGIVAILLVGAAYLVLRGSSISMTQATQWLEILSYALIALFGGWLLFRKLRSLWRSMPAAQPMELAMAGPAGGLIGHDHSSQFHDHSHAHGHLHAPGHNHGHDLGHAHHSHSPGVVCDTCGHAHAPDPQMLRADNFSIQEAWSAIIAVGLRPCSGALLVLTFSLLNGLYLGGILSVLAMSVGTAITVSTLAILAVTAKDLAMRYAGHGSTASMRIANAIEIVGAGLVLIMGLLLLGAALQA